MLKLRRSIGNLAADPDQYLADCADSCLLARPRVIPRVDDDDALVRIEHAQALRDVGDWHRDGERGNRHPARARGVVIVQSTAGSPAARAGLRGIDTDNDRLGDVVVGVDGRGLGSH